MKTIDQALLVWLLTDSGESSKIQTILDELELAQSYYIHSDINDGKKLSVAVSHLLGFMDVVKTIAATYEKFPGAAHGYNKNIPAFLRRQAD